MRKVLILASLVALALTAGACSSKKETVSSNDIKTHGIYAAIDVIGTSTGNVTVRAELKVGGEDSNTHVILDNGDKITATGGTETKTLTASSEGLYEAQFSGSELDTAYKIDFQRPSDTSAPNSNGKIPGPFEISALPTTKPSRANDDLVIKWTPSEAKDDIYIYVKGDCIYDYENTKITQDPGTFTIPKGTLKSTGEKDGEPNDCSLKVTVIKIRPGSLDPAFGSGYVHLQQRREATFVSAQ
ncbi:MAG: hypothetical protein HY898_08210 [Deltaproteobacteria bacterium]|nr:hypothetical protein [Deltaproteobacteria bacterium]